MLFAVAEFCVNVYFCSVITIEFLVFVMPLVL